MDSMLRVSIIHFHQSMFELLETKQAVWSQFMTFGHFRECFCFTVELQKCLASDSNFTFTFFGWAYPLLHGDLILYLSIKLIIIQLNMSRFSLLTWLFVEWKIMNNTSLQSILHFFSGCHRWVDSHISSASWVSFSLISIGSLKSSERAVDSVIGLLQLLKRSLLLTTDSPVVSYSFIFLWNPSFSSHLGEFPKHPRLLFVRHRVCILYFPSLSVFQKEKEKKKSMIEFCFLQSSRGKGIFIRIRTWEHTKAAIVGSLMGMLSTSRQSCLLSWVFTTLSQPAGIWKLRGKSIFFFFFLIPARVHQLSSLSVLLSERPAVCGGRNGIKAND